MTDPISIVAYDPGWPRLFAAERERIRGVLGSLAVRIDHHGSTSVPGLAAKPVIDIQISVRSLYPMEAYDHLLARLGYVHLPHPDDAFCPFFHRPAAWPHTHHIHVVAHGGDEERRTLAFRDYLREHEEARSAYAELKRELAGRFSAGTIGSRQAYAEAKADFITRITDRALAAGYAAPRG